MRQIRNAIGGTTIHPALLTAAERIQYEGYLRREETNAAILALLKDGMPIKQIARRTGHSRKLVRQVIRGERNDVFPVRQSSLDVHLAMARRPVGRRWPKRSRTLATLGGARLPWLAPRRERMGDRQATS
jgi:transposase